MNLARNIVTTLSGRVVVMGMSLVSAVVLARYLGPDRRGAFALALLLPELAVAFGRLGFDQSNAVYAGLEPNRRRALSWHSAVIAVLAGGLLALIGVVYILLGAPGLSRSMSGPRWYFILPLLLVPGRMLIEYWLAILRGMNQIVLLNLVEVGIKVVSLLLAVGIVALDGGLAGVLSLDSAVVVGSVLVLACILANAGALGRPTFDKALFQRSAGFAMPSYLAGVMTFLNYRIDQFVIAFMLPMDQLAIYVIAVEIAERIWIIPGAIGAALLPHLTNSQVRDPMVAAAVARHGVIWTGAGCLVLFAIAPFAIELLFSADFVGAASPLRWLLPGIFSLAIGKVIIAELQAREKILFTVWLSVLSAAVNIVLNAVLIPRMGIAGAAAASSVSYLLVAIVVVWYYVRETGISCLQLFPRVSDVRVYLSLAGIGQR